MIKIVSVERKLGNVYLTFQFDYQQKPQQIVVDANEIVERMKQLKMLVGRTLTLQDLKNIIVKIFEEIREGKEPLFETFNWEDYIGVDLERN